MQVCNMKNQENQLTESYNKVARYKINIQKFTALF